MRRDELLVYFARVPWEVDRRRLDESAREEAARGSRREHSNNALATSRLTEDGDMGRITAERCDVAVDPFEGLNLVHDAIAAGGEIPSGEQPQSANAIVDRHDNNVVPACKVAAIVVNHGRSARGEGTAVEVDGDRPPHSAGAVGHDRGEHIEIQTVFGNALLGSECRNCLGTRAPKLRRVKALTPGIFTRWCKAQLANRGVCKGDPKEAERACIAVSGQSVVVRSDSDLGRGHDGSIDILRGGHIGGADSREWAVAGSRNCTSLAKRVCLAVAANPHIVVRTKILSIDEIV